MNNILTFGELLYDVYDNVSVIGGAPFNYSLQLSRLINNEDKLRFITALGNDDYSKDAINFINNENIDSSLIEILDNYETGKATVFLNEKKVPDYIIHENVAWDNIEYNENIEKALQEKYDMFYFNILSQRNEKSYSTLKKIFKNIDSKYKVCDVTFRKNYYTKDKIKESLEFVNILKINDDELAVIKDEGIKALKIFTTYRNVGYLVEDRNELKAIFKDARDLGMMITVHAEDDKTIEDIAAAWDRDFKPASHADLRPADAEAKAILYVGHIAAELGMPIYIVHLSSRKGLEAVRQLRSEGVEVIVETTPTYLFLDRSLLEREDGSLFIMTPPLRTKDDNKALLEALVDGEIQVVATDHCSFTYAQKLESDDCRTVYPGIPGTEELLPLLHTFSVETGRIGINDIVRLLSRNPAHYFSLYPEKGSLEAGTDADIIIFNPHEEWTLSSSTLHSASGYTAYDGRKVIGKTMRTYLRGRLIVSGSEYYGISGEGHFIASRI